MVTVAVSGLHGTGKSTAARALADKFNLQYISAGEVFRRMAEERNMDLTEFSEYVEDHPEVDKEIDQRTVEKAKEDNVLVDARLAGWMVENPDINILLVAPVEERIRRIANRENSSYKNIMEETLAREGSERKRFKDLYGIDVEDYSPFDLVLDTEKFDKEAMIQILVRAVELVIE